MDAAGAAARGLHHLFAVPRQDVQASFDAQLKKLLTQITASTASSTTGDSEPGHAAANLYEPLFEVTHSGWYWQITPDRRRPGAQARLASLATASCLPPSESNVARPTTPARAG